MDNLSILQAGDLVDRFRIVKQIGSGGMGEVYLALDKKDYRNVALKVIKSGSPDFKRMLAWFQREVALYRKIAHPNVVNFIAAGQVRGIHYVALEHIIGISLRQWLNRHGPVALRKAFSWTQDLTFALHAAHQQNIIHRDIKPENIMITKDETIKIIDFGLARTGGPPTLDEKAEHDRLFERGRPRDGRLSGDSGIVGTLSYLAPELLHGCKADGRSDIYALGLVFYEMLTGQILIQDVSSAAAIMDRHRQVNRMSSFLPRPVESLAEELEWFVLQMLKADPNERFSSTQEMVEAMQRLVDTHGAQLQDSSRQAGKRLAQQELVDTHFWQAMNLFAEKRIVDAVEELFKIFTFASSLDGASKETVVRELDILFYALRIRRKSGECEDSPFVLTKEESVDLLKKIMRLYRAMAPPNATRLKMLVFLRKMREYLSPTEFDGFVQEVLPHHIGDAMLTRAFVESLIKQNPLVAKDVWLKFAGELLLKGCLCQAKEELLAYIRQFGEDEQADECFRDLIFLERSYQEEESQVLGLLGQMAGRNAIEHSVTTCISFLTKYPDSVAVQRVLAGIYESEHRSRKLADVYSRIGVILFWCGGRDEAREYFIKALELNERDSNAINYLCEMLDQKGLLGSVPHSRRALLQRIYEVLGLFPLVRRELERRLSGTLQDMEIYTRIRDIALKSDYRDEAWVYDFKIGELNLNAGDFAAARACFEQGLDRAPDLKAAAGRLKQLPGIHKVYSIAELARKGRELREQKSDSGGESIDKLRKIACDRGEKE